jgi:uncharacterized protein with NRDE domain
MVDRYPVIIAANRDEHFDRPTAPPALWSTEPKILAGKDLLAGGTWLGVNEHGLLVGILNRRSNGGPDPLNKTRSRGLLCLDLLSLKSAADAHAFVSRHQEPYQPFTVVFVDQSQAWIAYNVGQQIKAHKLDVGLHVYSSAAEFAVRSEKIDRAHVQFARVSEELQSNCTDKAVWVRSLHKVLGDHTLGNGSNDPRDAICVHGDVAGTVSSTIIFYDQLDQRLYTFNCPGTPCRGAFGEALVLNVR